MKPRAKWMTTALLAGAIVVASGMATGCASSSRNGEIMYTRQQSNKGATIKSNIKVKGSNKRNGHTTRSY